MTMNLGSMNFAAVATILVLACLATAQGKYNYDCTFWLTVLYNSLRFFPAHLLKPSCPAAVLPIITSPLKLYIV
jgi:hypothetical protein